MRRTGVALFCALLSLAAACDGSSDPDQAPDAAGVVGFDPPDWLSDAVVYAPIPALWGDDGPDEVRRKLPYLESLGVDVLWLWPPTSLRAEGEEYAIVDYLELDPSWGPEAAFKAMVDAAHDRGMKVMVDFVPNHLSVESPYFEDALAEGEDSEYWDYFQRRRDGRPEHYFDWEHLPNLNFDNPEVRELVTGSVVYWADEYDIDGFRMDVAWGVRERAPDFWPEVRVALDEIDPDIFLLAEATALDGYYSLHGFDAAYDWTMGLGDWAWGAAFDLPGVTGERLAEALTATDRLESPAPFVWRFLNNNDTGRRFVDRYGPEVTEVAAVLQFTVPGIPALFAGDEIGASYEPYSNLQPIGWTDPHGLHPLYSSLIELRRETPALTSRDMAVLTAEPSDALAYVRPSAGDAPVLVVLNFGPETDVEIEGPALRRFAGRDLVELLTGRSVRLAGGETSASVHMDATSALVLRP